MLDVLTVADVAAVPPMEWAEFAYHYGLPLGRAATPARPSVVLPCSPLYIPDGWAELPA